jgi:ferredoxin--NADP+ reductase
MFEVLESRMIVPNIHLLKVRAPEVAREIKAGQFVILRADEEGERIPLNVSDWDAEAGTITIIFMNAGSSTNDLAAIEAGTSIPTVVGPLGIPTEIDKFGTVMLVGGCYGIGSILPIARALKEAGNRVVAVLEARSSYLIYWDRELSDVADHIVYITRDGTKGHRGHVSRLPEIINTLGEKIDRIIINGCTLLLKRGADVSRPTGIKTIVALNPIMMDGTGMCGVCRVTVGGETKFACVDGPDFDGHQVDWTELLQRRRTYMSEEVIPTRTSRCEEHAAARLKESEDG